MPSDLEPGASIDVLQQGGLMDQKIYTGRRVSLDFKGMWDPSDLNVPRARLGLKVPTVRRVNRVPKG